MSNPIIEAARAQGRTLLNEVEAKTILAEAGVPVTPTKLATSPDEAVTVAAEMGYPVALKVVSEAITHKSDIGGVELNLADEAAVRSAFDRIAAAAEAAAPGATVDGVSGGTVYRHIFLTFDFQTI